MKLFPYTFYNVTGRLIKQPEVSRMIANDQQLFSAFFSMALNVLLFDIDNDKADESLMKFIIKITSVTGKSFSIDELGNTTKLAESIRSQLGQNVTAEYMGKFLAFCDLFHRTSNKADIISVIETIGDSICKNSLKNREADYLTSTEANVTSVANIYELDITEKVLLEHAALLSVDFDAHAFYKLYEIACERKGAFKSRIETALAHVYEHDISSFLGTKAALKAVDRVTSSLTSKLLAFNIVRLSSTGGVKQLSQFWTQVITYDQVNGEEGLIGLFVTPIKEAKTWSSVIARMNDKMIPLFRNLLVKCNKTAETKLVEAGINVMLYGPASLDKDQALHRSLANISYQLYEANTKTEAWGDEASITWAAQRILQTMTINTRELHVLLVREAATVLSRGRSRMSFASFMKNESSDDSPKQELSSDEILLTKSYTPTFWYTSDPTSLSQEAVGKFMLHLEIIPGTRADRKLEVEKIADSLNLPAEVRQSLSKYMELGAMQVETAARVINMLSLKAPESYETLLQLVEESQRALGRDKTEELRTSVTKYDLGLLNIRSKYTPAQVIDALKIRPAATLCFYGLPGTGKTQLAEYIADKLDKPLLIKRASDLMSKWVGDNERNIAEMFHEAKAEGSILLLDEADSFLRDRSLSKNSWEVTMVNELLQQMERFSGIFICTSNLFDQLDAAALRRFTFKFSFQELSDIQRIVMFANESGVKPEENSKLWDDLMLIKHLTPGDFATVKRQSNLFNTTLTPDEWIIQLQEEAKAKNAGLNRNKFNLEM